MDAQSPPKRLTRARAAAKTSEPAEKSNRVVTAAAKVKAARTTSAAAGTRTAAKRKSPCDEEDDDLELAPAKKMSTADAKPTRGRGRPKKTVVEEAAPVAANGRSTATTARGRGRPKKIMEPVADEPTKPVRTTRTKNAETAVAEQVDTAAETVQKTTRGRSAIATSGRTTATKSLTKPAVKKTVTFEEPEKENIVPAAKALGSSATAGLRGKPVRKAATAGAARTSRNTRAAVNTTELADKEERPMPLSPKKINQLAMNIRVESDDELGMDEKAPVRRFKKVPIKPATKPPALVKTSVPASQVGDTSAAAGPEPAVNLMLATPAKRPPPSPWKGSIASPARRVEGLFATNVAHADSQSTHAPAKMRLLQSPAKRQPLNVNLAGADSMNATGSSPVKLSFLSSPAKRSISPIKAPPIAFEPEERTDRSPAPKPTLLASPVPRTASNDREMANGIAKEDGLDGPTEGDIVPESPTRLSFPGRLSAVLPRHADPAMLPSTLAVPEETSRAEAQDDTVKQIAEESASIIALKDTMVLDLTRMDGEGYHSASTTPPSSPPKAVVNPLFELREKDVSPFDHSAESESEDESPFKRGKFTSAFTPLPATPCAAPLAISGGRQSVGGSTIKVLHMDDKFGFTPLAQQLSGWTAGPSPAKTGVHATLSTSVLDTEATSTVLEQTPNTFFEDEMHIRPDPMEIEEEASTDVEDNDEPIMEDVPFEDEDVALAAEANEMSLLEKEENEAFHQDHDDSVSEASQEYADENAIPVDPTLVVGNVARAPSVPPVTPQRVIHREFHTVAKVPLKAADESTPRPRIETRSYSASKVPLARPTERLTRNATVISYSPSKGGDVDPFEEPAEEGPDPALPVTPEKPDVWSTLGTPARTPRRDVNPALLRGAVVFVDVHTSEGADASGIFVELLSQMGARCVKTWSWNPSNSAEQGGDPRVGITHVVYKDGGKRTLEKVRESRGLVQCVGVSWVLE